MIYNWTLESFRRHFALAERLNHTHQPIPGEIAVALADIALAAQHVVEADRSAWQQSELDNAVIRLREMFGGQL